MKKLEIILLLLVVLLYSSCKKQNLIGTPDTPEKIIESPFLRDSTSFTIHGKHYTNKSRMPGLSRGYGNRGVNIKLSPTNGKWGMANGNNGYWVGSPDSVQYSSDSSTILAGNAGVIEVSFIEKYKRSNAVKMGTFYFPRIEDQFYTLGDYRYAVDFTRTNNDVGIAIKLSLYDKTLTTYSQRLILYNSTLTADSQRNSKFKVLKIEDIEGTDYVVLSATFEATLFDDKENPTKVTDGFFRITTLKTGERMGFYTMFY